MEIDLDRKANKIAKAQSQLKSRQGEKWEQRGEEKESKRKKYINTGLALRESRVMSTSSTHTEYWTENMDTPSWPADRCVTVCLIAANAWDLQPPHFLCPGVFERPGTPNDDIKKQHIYSGYLLAEI